MRRSACCLVLAACGFEHGALTGDDTACGTTAWWDKAYAHRFLLTAQAPTGYTLQLDATAIVAQSFTSSRDDVRVVVDGTEIDRLVTGTTLELKMPPEGTIYVYAGNASPPAPLADPARVYLFAESFDSLALGDNGTSKFDAQPAAEWSVVDDLGNHVYRARGTYRHPAPIRNLTMRNGEIRARLRWGQGTGQQHNGLGARGSNMQIATMDGFVGQLQADVSHSRIAEYSDGVSPPAELIVQDFTIDRTRWYELRLRFFENDLAFAIDGTPTLVATKSGWDGMTVGLFAHDCDVDYDDVRVRMYVQPEPAVTVGPDEKRCP